MPEPPHFLTHGEVIPKSGGHPIRVLPANLDEKLALDQAKALAARGRGDLKMGAMGNPNLERLYGEGEWRKMEYIHRTPDGKNIVIHWFQNLDTGRSAEFKFKNPPLFFNKDAPFDPFSK